MVFFFGVLQNILFIKIGVFKFCLCIQRRLVKIMFRRRMRAGAKIMDGSCSYLFSEFNNSNIAAATDAI